MDFVSKFCRKSQVWRLLTYMFVHENSIHVVSNIIAQSLFGLPFEITYGSLATGIIYVCGVLTGLLLI